MKLDFTISASVSKNFCITTFKGIHAKFNLILLSLYPWKPIKSHLEILCNARNCFKAFQKIGYIEFRIFWSISNNSKERCTCFTNILERIFHIVCLFDNCYSCLNMEIYKYANFTTVLRTHVLECSWNLISSKYYEGRKIIHISVM